MNLVVSNFRWRRSKSRSARYIIPAEATTAWRHRNLSPVVSQLWQA